MALKISSTPELNINMPNIMKIEKFLHDSAYSELIELSSNFNTRLCVERKLRMPFLDPQTGVAQNHSNLFMKKAQRMPGMRDGQIYTYPSLRWRNKCNSVKLSSRPFFRFRAADNCTTNIQTSTPAIPNPVTISSSNNCNNTIINSSNSNPTQPSLDGDASDFQALIDESNSMTGVDTDSKDSSQEVVPKEWYYDDINDNDVVSEEQPDSDFDYNINGYKRKKKGAVRKTSRKTKDSFAGDESNSVPKKSRTNAGRSGTGSRSSRNKKGTPSSTSSSSRSNKSSNKKDKSEPIDIEPPSFDSVNDDLKLNDNSADSFAYRKFMN